MDANLYWWDGAALRVVDDGGADGARLLVADSWLVTEGKVRYLLGHYRRFARSVEATLGERWNLWDFMSTVSSLLPHDESAFPRIELVGDDDRGHSLQLRMRPAPTIEPTIRLITREPGDPRTSPLVKGPDLSMLMQLRRRAKMHDADDMVLLDENGRVLECALGALMWWDGETLCTPPSSEHVFPSITRKLLLTIAETANVPISYRWVTPSDLSGTEVWSVSALHGIRLVTSWCDGIDGPMIELESTGRHKIWQRRLNSIATGIPQFT